MRFFGFGFLGGMPPSALSREVCVPAPLRETASEADRSVSLFELDERTTGLTITNNQIAAGDTPCWVDVCAFL